MPQPGVSGLLISALRDPWGSVGMGTQLFVLSVSVVWVINESVQSL